MATPGKTITTDLSASRNDQSFVDLSSPDVTVTYTSANPAVASVDANGVVTAVAGGVTTITATVTENGVSVSDSYPVVVEETIAATGITVDGAPLDGFDPMETSYTVTVSSFDPMPVVAATAADGVTVTVEQATAENPVATITLTKGEVSVVYTISFFMELQSFDFTTATEEELFSTWSIVRENAEKWSLGENGLTIGTEYGDLYMNYTNNAKNLFMQNAPGDWEVETSIELSALPSQNYQQVALIAYQDDDNYLKLGYQGNNSGKKAVEINIEQNGTFRDTAPFSQSVETTKLWLRLKKAGDTYTGSYSTDGVVFTELGTQTWPLEDVKLVLTANNGTGTGAGEIQATFKDFTVLSSGQTYDFRNLESLPAGWSVFNPTENGVTFSENGAVIHTGTKDGAGAVENQLQLTQPLSGDWTVETHFTLSRPLQASYEQFGIFFAKDNDNYIRINQERGSSTNIQLVVFENGGVLHDSPLVNVGDCTDVYFRMKNVGGIFEMYYSFDGEQWSYLGSEDPAGDFTGPGSLRLYATSQNANNSSYDATVEYCIVTEGSGPQEQWPIHVEDSDCCDVTYTVNPEGKLDTVVPDGGTVTFTITPNEGKVISARTITVSGITGSVTKTVDDSGVWTVTVPSVKSEITLSVAESFGATAITYDGRSLKGFDTDKLEYVANVTELPKEVQATASEGAEVQVEQPTEENPVATITVTANGQTLVYTVTFEITPETTQATNPYLPLWEHIADGEPHVFEDPDNPGEYRVYIYGSHDSNRTSYCGREYVTWSAPVDDLTAWRYEGVIYSCADNGASSSTLFAPDVAYKDGTYYLYIHDWGHSQTLRVATSDRPDGPFTFENEGGHDGALVQNPEHTSGDLRVDFDPAVLVDDDGKAYLYWGGYQRTGFGSGQLSDDMMTLIPETYTRSNMTNSNGGNHETGAPFYFYEGPSIRKVEDMYVLVYCQMAPQGSDPGVVHNNYRARLAYAYSENPLGPWTYGGVIIDNGGELLPDGTLSYQDGNNHGGIVEINGQWYVFYHRMTKNNEYARQSLMEPIDLQVTVDENGNKAVVIPQVEMTSQGANTEGLDAYQQQDAGIACYLTGGAYITTGYRENPDYNPIVNLKNGNVVGYKYLNFGQGAGEGQSMALELELQPKGEAGTIDIYLDKPNADEGTKIGTIEIPAGAGEYQTVQAPVSNVTGTHAVYLVFQSEGAGEICEINKLQFVTGSSEVDEKDLSVAVSGADTVKQDQRVPYTFSFSGEKENLGNVTVIFNIKGDPAGLFTGGAFEAAGGFSKYVMDEEEQADGSRRVKVVLAYGMDELTALEEAALTDELTDLFTYVIRSSAEQEGEIEVTVEQAIFTYAGDNDLYYADVTGATASTSVSAKDPYDIDGDGDFDQADITAAQGYYRAAEGDENWDEARKADVNRDGVVDLTDLVELATAWLDTL